MGSLGSPNTITWVPYMNNRDCSQGFCSVYCPQWCYIIIPPPPPPPPIYFPDGNSFPNFSPLVVAIIGIFASALLLVSYYTIISKYCGNTDQNRRSQNRNANEEYLEDNRNPSSLHEPWHVTTTGLDEALIKSITVCKYKKGDGLVGVTECSVCLSEFQENESIRLLPKCSHAFHIPCIDTWFKSHSNCPLCRANIVSINVLTNSASPLRTEDNSISNEPLDESQRVNENVTMSQDTRRVDGDHQEIEDGDQVFDPKNPMSASYSDIGNSEERDTIIEIRGDEEGFEEIRRSLSMDNYFQNRVLVADILHMNHHEDVENEQEWLSDHACSSKKSDGEDGRCNNRKGVMRTVMDSIAVKRSFSSGRLFLSRPGRGKQTSTVPV